MKEFYQHADDVIESARALRVELVNDAPFGNIDEAKEWARERYPEIFALADQTTEGEEIRAVGHGSGA